MKSDKYFFDYRLQPGLNEQSIEYKDKMEFNNPKVSIITSYYNAHKYMWQTINCVLNQTFPYWEWIIVDDGSSDEVSIAYLKKIENLDKRIKVFRKKNEGLAKGRDYAIKKSTTDYILPLDSDDLINSTYIETAYWAMETNKSASWAYTNSVGFGKYLYLSDYNFDSERMKNENQITATSLIRKESILKLGGYGVAKRYVNEDWHLWLRMLANDEFPVQIGYYGFWYRRRYQSLLTEINDEEKKENKLRLRDLKNEADKIRKKVNAIIYPKKQDSQLEYNKLNWNKNFPKFKRECILYILPTTGFDKKTFKNIRQNSKLYNIIIVSIENTNRSQYALRQKYEEFAAIFDLSTFLDTKYYLGFIEYITKTRDINQIYVASSKYKDCIDLTFPNAKMINYKESNMLYNLNICKYKISHTIMGRAIRKIKGLIKTFYKGL